jgi:hypothetical protein
MVLWNKNPEPVKQMRMTIKHKQRCNNTREQTAKEKPKNTPIANKCNVTLQEAEVFLGTKKALLLLQVSP